MSTIRFDLTGNALEKLDKLMVAMGDTTPAMSTIGRIFKTKIQFCFRDSKDPWGTPWERLKVRKGKPLIDTAVLYRSINFNAVNGYVEIGTNIEYGPYQNFGFTKKVDAHEKEVFFMRDEDGEVGNRFVSPGKSNFAQKVMVKAHDVIVPARPFIPIREGDILDIPDSWMNDANKALLDYFEDIL